MESGMVFITIEKWYRKQRLTERFKCSRFSQPDLIYDEIIDRVITPKESLIHWMSTIDDLRVDNYVCNWGFQVIDKP